MQAPTATETDVSVVKSFLCLRFAPKRASAAIARPSADRIETGHTFPASAHSGSLRDAAASVPSAKGVGGACKLSLPDGHPPKSILRTSGISQQSGLRRGGTGTRSESQLGRLKERIFRSASTPTISAEPVALPPPIVRRETPKHLSWAPDVKFVDAEEHALPDAGSPQALLEERPAERNDQIRRALQLADGSRGWVGKSTRERYLHDLSYDVGVRHARRYVNAVEKKWRYGDDRDLVSIKQSLELSRALAYCGDDRF